MQQDEPSLEEILASIRKIMTRDEAAAHAQTADRPEEASSNIESGPVEPASHDEADDILDLGEHMLLADTSAAEQPETLTTSLPSLSDSLTLETGDAKPPLSAADSIRHSLAALEQLMKEETPAVLAAPLDPAMEDLTRQTLRPMLEDWLEAHLPAIVERLVQAEIARIVDGRR